jgi:hypothetical protein
MSDHSDHIDSPIGGIFVSGALGLIICLVIGLHTFMK